MTDGAKEDGAGKDGAGVTTRMYLFDTTNQAMWAEEVAMQSGIPAEVVPAPPEAESKCGLALRTPIDRAEGLERAMDEAGVEFTVFAR